MIDRKLKIISIFIAAIAAITSLLIFVFGEGVIWRRNSDNSDLLLANTPTNENSPVDNSVTSILPETTLPTAGSDTSLQPTTSPSSNNFDTNNSTSNNEGMPVESETDTKGQESADDGSIPVGINPGNEKTDGNSGEKSKPTSEGNNSDESILDDPFIVPNVVGMEYDVAVDLLLNIGFARVSASGISVPAEHYYIYEQSIPEGSTAYRGTDIELTVITKPLDSATNVPNVIGMEQHEATALLAESGLQFQVWWTEENNISSEYYYIIDQSIPANSSVPAGTLVQLELSPIKKHK